MKLLIAAVTIALGSQLTFAKNSAQKSEAINLQVTEKGFEPNTIDVKPGMSRLPLGFDRAHGCLCGNFRLVKYI